MCVKRDRKMKKRGKCGSDAFVVRNVFYYIVELLGAKPKKGKMEYFVEKRHGYTIFHRLTSSSRSDLATRPCSIQHGLSHSKSIERSHGDKTRLGIKNQGSPNMSSKSREFLPQHHAAQNLISLLDLHACKTFNRLF